MVERFLADTVLVLHAAFVLFVAAGGFSVLRWPRLAWLHLPAAAWGAAVEFFGLDCPLTHLEIALREAAGQAGYSGSFVERSLLPLLYPPGFAPPLAALLGFGVLAVNVPLYAALALRRARRAQRERSGSTIR